MNRKLIWKFNIMDLLIIGILILGIGALIYRGVVGGNEENSSFEITYTCSGAPIEILDDIDCGQFCVDGDLGGELGIVSKAETEAIPGSNLGNSVITTIAEGSETEHGILIDDNVYLKGKKFNLIIGDAVFDVYISDIKRHHSGN